MPPARRIDFHFHFIPQFYRDAVYEAGGGPAIGRYPDWSPQSPLDVMDANAIEVALVSVAQPGVQFGDPRTGCALARRCNEYAAELKARWPQLGDLQVVTTPAIPRNQMGKIDRLKLREQGIAMMAGAAR